MHSKNFQDTRAFWDSVAEDWDIQVGTEGDDNRRFNSDPVLWQFAGDVDGLAVLDAGCGTGYLTNKLAVQGARVTGIDLSPQMIAVAKANNPVGDFREDSCTQLATIDDGSMDLVIANYVLMDTPDLDATMSAFYRVLVPGGHAVLVFSHPCFPQGGAMRSEQGDTISYRWDVSYFESRQMMDPPWGHFTSSFIWFHRPLSDYWKGFRRAGFDVLEFEEPRITEERFALAGDEKTLKKHQSRPYSVAFKLKKPT